MRLFSCGKIAPAVVPALMIGLFASAAGAETQLLAGKRLALRQSPKSEQLVVVSRDQLVAPLPGGSDDPTLLGAALDIGNPRTGEWVRFTIPATGWTLNALGTVFRYEGGRPRAVGGVRELIIRHGKRLKLRATAAGVSLDEPSQGGLAVVLTTGSRRYCMMFNGRSVKRDEPRRFAARNAPAPATCPAPPVSTTTTSTQPSPPSTTTSTTRPSQETPSSTSTTSTSSSSTPGPTVTTSSTSSTKPVATTSSSTTAPPTTVTTTTALATSTSTSSSSTSSTSATSTSSTVTSTSSTTSTTGYTCNGFALFCGGTCPPGATCVGGLVRPCTCQVLE